MEVRRASIGLDLNPTFLRWGEFFNVEDRNLWAISDLEETFSKVIERTGYLCNGFLGDDSDPRRVAGLFLYSMMLNPDDRTSWHVSTKEFWIVYEVRNYIQVGRLDQFRSQKSGCDISRFDNLSRKYLERGLTTIESGDVNVFMPERYLVIVLNIDGH